MAMRGVSDEDLNLGCYCQCGAVMEGKSVSEPERSILESSFWDRHQGDGHGKADKETARKMA